MSRKIGPLIIDLQGISLTQEECEILAHPMVGGVILFSRHYESPTQLRTLCQAIRAARKLPCLIMTDQEGGRVQRFKNQFSRLPSMRVIGQLYESQPQEALHFAKNYGWLMAKELLNVGIDMSLAPVVDLDKNRNAVIDDRAFHREGSIVATLAKAVIAGMNDAGMTATIKHFPGHGDVSVDSHLALPVDERTLSQVFASDMVPFVQLINAGVHSIMAAHILFPEIDAVPVGYSKIWLNDILRNKLNFKGVILSDDLNMMGAELSPQVEDRVAAAKVAGCDFTLFCNNRDAVIQVIDRLAHQSYLVEEEKWGKLCGNFQEALSTLEENPKWQQAKQQLKQYE